MALAAAAVAVLPAHGLFQPAQRNGFAAWAWLRCHLNQGALNTASELRRIFDILIPFAEQISDEHPRPISFTRARA